MNNWMVSLLYELSNVPSDFLTEQKTWNTDYNCMVFPSHELLCESWALTKYWKTSHTMNNWMVSLQYELLYVPSDGLTEQKSWCTQYNQMVSLQYELVCAFWDLMNYEKTSCKMNNWSVPFFVLVPSNPKINLFLKSIIRKFSKVNEDFET